MKKIIIYVETYIKYKSSIIKFWIVDLLGFELQNSHDNDLKLKQFKHIRLFHNIDKILYIICYNHYLPKFSKLKNQVLKLKFKI